MAYKNLLTNVVIIRPILVVLLVTYHAFAPYGGAWNAIEGCTSVRAYWWLDKLSYAVMLETFVFVSGYVFGYQVRTKCDCKLNAKSLLWGKFKRLIIPSMVFSLLYIILFDNNSLLTFNTLYNIANGVAHMWFLPMLFWCFVLIWILEQLNIKPLYVFVLLLFCSVFSFIPFPLRMNVSLYYMFFFYVGYFMQSKGVDLSRFYTMRFVIILAIAFVVLFPIFTLFRENAENIIEGDQIVMKTLRITISNLTKIIYSSVGLAMLLLLVGTVDKMRAKPLPQWYIDLGGLCMGVYLFQQFILKALYYYTSFPEIFGSYWLPWVGFFIAFSGSLLLSFLTHKTKIGRFLIG